MTSIFNDITLSKDLKVIAIKCFFIVQIFLFHSAYSFADDSKLNLLSVPNGFEISIFAENISSPRQLLKALNIFLQHLDQQDRFTHYQTQIVIMLLIAIELLLKIFLTLEELLIKMETYTLQKLIKFGSLGM